MASLLFAASVGLAAVVIALFSVLGSDAILPAAVSIGLTLVLIVRNDRGGVVRLREIRRAHEPARYLGDTQVLVLVLLIMVQFFLSVYWPVVYG